MIKYKAPKEPFGPWLKIRTLKCLRLWCVMSDLQEGGTVSAALRRGLNHMAIKRGDKFRQGYYNALDIADTEAFEKESDPTEVEPLEFPIEAKVKANCKRKVGFRVDTSAVRALKVYCAMTDTKQSETADECIYWHCIERASVMGDEFFDVWAKAVCMTSYPEDQKAVTE